MKPFSYFLLFVAASVAYQVVKFALGFGFDVPFMAQGIFWTGATLLSASVGLVDFR
jgi:hypothetical protein